ncbi:hypothetical protein QJS04_geneDACA000193 [Acorus gramineus]|uniref:Uncharacterized protein n=1 Tax=Acorus gramineus TaxID=55184 RepID=A0AAV9AR57_ACOGR|nr:hypothetical protein QJS04_geneDACA000193 [Acorus gramineus]
MAFQGGSSGWVRRDGQKVYSEGSKRGWVSEVVPERGQRVISVVAHSDGYQGGGCVESKLAGKVGGMLDHPRLSASQDIGWLGLRREMKGLQSSGLVPHLVWQTDQPIQCLKSIVVGLLALDGGGGGCWRGSSGLLVGGSHELSGVYKGCGGGDSSIGRFKGRFKDFITKTMFKEAREEDREA